MSRNLASKNIDCEYQDILRLLLGKTTNPKLGLKRVIELLQIIDCLSIPGLKIIQVVGTNGKGSTVAFAESILRNCGVSTGLFTSPHLCTVRERIRINGTMVRSSDFVLAAKEVLRRAQALKEEPSFFEYMLAIALWLFKSHGISVAILEAGLGGRLDATSAIFANVLGVAMIDLDHQHILGSTVEEIAFEKINAAKPGSTVITVKQKKEVQAVIENAKDSIGFSLFTAEPCFFSLGLYGEHQKTNAGLALALIDKLGLNFIPKPKIKEGLLRVNWPGRFEVISDDMDVVLDGAHNPSGITCLNEGLKAHPRFSNRPLVMVYGSLESSNAPKKIELIAQAGHNIQKIFLHQPNNERALDHKELTRLFVNASVPKDLLIAYENWDLVRRYAKEREAFIVVCGSLYTVGTIMSIVRSIDLDSKMPNF